MKGLLTVALALFSLQVYAVEGSQNKLKCTPQLTSEQIQEAALLGLDTIKSGADNQDPKSLNMLGLLYLSDTLVDKDTGKGLAYIEQAAGLGRSGAIEILSKLYLCGGSAEFDRTKGIQWLEKHVSLLAEQTGTGERPIKGRFTNEYFAEALKLIRWYDYLQDEINEGKFSTLLDGLIKLSKINTDLYQYIYLNKSWSPHNKEFNSEKGYKEHYKYKYKYSFSRQSELLNIRERLKLKQAGDKKITIVIDKIKTIDGSYKNGNPDGVWTAWYPNGKIFAKMKFADISSYSNDDYNIEIVDIEVRYPDKTNTIKYKGNAFADKLLTGVHKDGGIVNYPQWSFISGYFNEVGSKGVYIPVDVYFTDSNTGKHYKFPWIDKYE